MPWYKQFWPWFLIALPLAVVMACFVTLSLFNRHPVSLVKDDYYQQGKTINLDLSSLRQANHLALQAALIVTSGAIFIRLDKGKLSAYPAITLALEHRTLAAQDSEATLYPTAQGQYQLPLAAPLQGPWRIKIKALDNSWALKAMAHFDTFPSPPIIFNAILQ